MILFITPSQCAQECADAIASATVEHVTVAESLALATSLLRAESYSAVVLDQFLLETAPDEADTAMLHAGTAVVVPVNLALCGRERLVREVRGALKRRQREEAAVRNAVLAQLQSEVNRAITGLMLSVDLALQAAPPEASDRLRTIRELVNTLCEQLGRCGAPDKRRHAVEV
jgi:hypothetical protein